MSVTVLSLGTFDVQLGNTTGHIYSNSLPQEALLIKVTADNSDAAGAHLISIFRSADGNLSNDTAANQLIGNLSIAANVTTTLPLSGQGIAPGGSLDGKADTGATVTISGTYAIVG